MGPQITSPRRVVQQQRQRHGMIASSSFDAFFVLFGVSSRHTAFLGEITILSVGRSLVCVE